MRTLLFVALLALTPLGAGCMKIHLDTDIEADGGGICRITVAMNREVADAVDRLGELDQQRRSEGADPSAMGDLGRDRLAAACAEAGVRLLQHELSDDARGVSLSVRLGFDHVADLSRALGGLGSEALVRRGEELRISRTEDGHFLLHVAPRPDAAPDPADPPPAPTRPGSEFLLHFAVLLEHVGELDVRRTITVPGEVISSNAREVEGRTSIWEVNAANMLEEQDTGLTPRILFTVENPDPGLTGEPTRR